MKLAPRPGLIIYLFFFGCSSFSSSSYADSCEETVQEVALNQGYIEKVSQSKDRKCDEKAIISEVVAEDGAKVNIKVNSLEYSMFELNGGGFKPYESLNVISSSYDEVLYAPVKADENGNILPIGLLPVVIGKSGGVCHIDILREKGSIHIKFPWGNRNIENN